jgi:hypothetical protein
MLPYESNLPIRVIVFDVNGDPVTFGGGGGGGDVNVLNFPESYPLPDDQVLALTPPAAITGFSTEAKQDDTITELQSLVAKDFATQTTLAAVLAKLIATPSTEAKQDDLITELQSLNGEDFATQTTLAAILAKIIADPSTEAKQDDVITELQSIDGNDFATQATLAAILTKLIAAPATEAKQDDIIAALGGDSDTGTTSTVNDTAVSTTLLAANSNRKGATFYNDSTATLYLKCGATASTTSFMLPVEPRGYLELPFKYTGIVDGIWTSDTATGAARITEFT